MPARCRWARTGTADAPCFQRVISLFSLCCLLLKKLSKSLIPLSDCPFVLNRLPVFLGKSPCFREKTDSQAMGLAKGEAVSAARGDDVRALPAARSPAAGSGIGRMRLCAV